MNKLNVKDQRNRPLRDLRISLTDQCNLRCRYCMPAEVFGPGYPFLKPSERMSFNEILRLVLAAQQLGVSKVRLTGGEPLMRRNVHRLVALLRSQTTVEDIALTTNGLLLKKHAQNLKDSGLNRINLSLDALDEAVFHSLSGGLGNPNTVVEAAKHCLSLGLPVKINTVLKAGVNENQIAALIRFGMEHDIEVRFIEYMDVGCSNGWDRHDVVSEKSVLKHIHKIFGSVEPLPTDPHSVSRSYVVKSNGYKFGIIASVTRPFCGGCIRARVASNGNLYTCLFSNRGKNLRPYLSEGQEAELLSNLKQAWLGRSDNYSETRSKLTREKEPIEMSYIGG